jgi:GTP1/Obg family GTP-binding protein
LFNNIKALFVNKPLLLVANKIDIKKIDELPSAKKVEKINTTTKLETYTQIEKKIE